MFKTFTLGRVFGVELRVHSTLFMLVGFVALMSLLGGGIAGAAGAVLTLAFLFLSVTLHELGHIGAARLFGIGTTGVTLYPFGGIARLTRESRTATEEVVVALAGPAVNVFLAGLAAIPMAFLGPVSLLSHFLWLNVVLAVFNLVPAYPMDGGRVLRGALWRRFGVRQATRMAAKAGQVFAVLGGLVGLFTSGMLVVVSVFVFLQASAELARLRLQELAQGPPAGFPEVYTADGRRVTPFGQRSAFQRPFERRQGPPVIIRFSDDGRRW